MTRAATASAGPPEGSRTMATPSHSSQSRYGSRKRSAAFSGREVGRVFTRTMISPPISREAPARSRKSAGTSAAAAGHRREEKGERRVAVAARRDRGDADRPRERRPEPDLEQHVARRRRREAAAQPGCLERLREEGSELRVGAAD